MPHFLVVSLASRLGLILGIFLHLVLLSGFVVDWGSPYAGWFHRRAPGPAWGLFKTLLAAEVAFFAFWTWVAAIEGSRRLRQSVAEGRTRPRLPNEEAP